MEKLESHFEQISIDDSGDELVQQQEVSKYTHKSKVRASSRVHV